MRHPTTITILVAALVCAGCGQRKAAAPAAVAPAPAKAPTASPAAPQPAAPIASARAMLAPAMRRRAQVSSISVAPAPEALAATPPPYVATLYTTLPVWIGDMQVGACGTTPGSAADVQAIEVHGQPQWKFWLGDTLRRDVLLATIAISHGSDGAQETLRVQLPDLACWSLWVKPVNGAGASHCESPMVVVDTAGFVRPPPR